MGTQADALAQNGLTFCQNPYDIERYVAIRTIVAEMFVHQNPSLLRKMFTGETADLVTWDIPKLVLNLPYYQQFGPLFGLPASS